MDLAIVAEVPLHVKDNGPSGRPGDTERQTLLGDQAPDGLRFRLVRNQEGRGGGKPFTTPRHHHGFQQIRWTESGSVNFAPGRDIAAGDLAYFPRGAYYGPQVKDNGTQLLLQFGFGDEYPSGGKEWYRHYQEGMRALSLRGTFEDGVFTDIDPETGEQRQRDAVEALFEERTKKKMVIPAEGYAAPTVMHPQAFAYYQAAPGVEIKHLGRFYDHPGPNGDVRIYMVRLSEGGVHQLGADRGQVTWTISPGLQFDGRVLPELTCVYSNRGEETALTGSDNVEIFVVEFPRLD
jgi:hypothetical protein